MRKATKRPSTPQSTKPPMGWVGVQSRRTRPHTLATMEAPTTISLSARELVTFSFFLWIMPERFHPVWDAAFRYSGHLRSLQAGGLRAEFFFFCAPGQIAETDTGVGSGGFSALRAMDDGANREHVPEFLCITYIIGVWAGFIGSKHRSDRDPIGFKDSLYNDSATGTYTHDMGYRDMSNEIRR